MRERKTVSFNPEKELLLSKFFDEQENISASIRSLILDFIGKKGLKDVVGVIAYEHGTQADANYKISPEVTKTSIHEEKITPTDVAPHNQPSDSQDIDQQNDLEIGWIPAEVNDPWNQKKEGF